MTQNSFSCGDAKNEVTECSAVKFYFHFINATSRKHYLLFWNKFQCFLNLNAKDGSNILCFIGLKRLLNFRIMARFYFITFIFSFPFQPLLFFTFLLYLFKISKNKNSYYSVLQFFIFIIIFYYYFLFAYK